MIHIITRSLVSRAFQIFRRYNGRSLAVDQIRLGIESGRVWRGYMNCRYISPATFRPINYFAAYYSRVTRGRPRANRRRGSLIRAIADLKSPSHPIHLHNRFRIRPSIERRRDALTKQSSDGGLLLFRSLRRRFVNATRDLVVALETSARSLDDNDDDNNRDVVDDAAATRARKHFTERFLFPSAAATTTSARNGVTIALRNGF